MNAIVFKLNQKDDFSTESSSIVDLTSKKDYQYTFFNSLRLLYKMPHFFMHEALDLWYISLMVYYADKKVLRKETFDNWTRQIKLYIPVIEVDKWNKNKKLLTEMISFLSGDIWEFEFRKRNLNELESKIAIKIPKSAINNKFNADAFCMLSGGLDSFIGAVDLLITNRNIAFIGHYSGGKGVKPFQDKVNKVLIDKFKLNENQFFNFNATPIKGYEDSTRTRSFMFFTHAIILASCLRKKIQLYIPENGLISLNIPLTNSRLGSSSTRTTHPYYMELFQTLLNNLGISITFKNPYQFLTKGGMLMNCKDFEFVKSNYINTMSCSHPDQGRYKKRNKSMHCGTCLPCTIRRASIHKAFNEDNTEYDDADYKGKKAQIELRSFKIGLKDFESNENNPFIIQIAGRVSNSLEDFTELYKRGMNEVANFLETKNE